MKRLWIPGRIVIFIILVATLLTPAPYTSARTDVELQQMAYPTSLAGLAIGIRTEDLSGIVDAGAVNVIQGYSPNGLDDQGNVLWSQASAGVQGEAEEFDYLSLSLAAGDFNRDGFVDLVMGVSNEDVDPGTGIELEDAGAVNVLYGTASGLSADNDQLWHQAVPGIDGLVEAEDHFGDSLTAGDFNGDGFDDLAIGVPGEDVDPGTGTEIEDAGAVNVLYGTASGLSAANDQVWHQAVTGIEGQAEENDGFGRSLTAGDFDGNGLDDLAIGVAENVDPGTGTEVYGAGAVNVIYGTASGLSAAGDQIWHQASPGIEGAVEMSDAFGMSLAAGDFDSDSYCDLAVGVPFEDVDPGTGTELEDAGAVNVIYGSSTGLNAAGDQIWHQAIPDIEGMLEAYDYFGLSLTVGDFDADGNSDLAIGIPLEGVDPGSGAELAYAGAVNVIYGSNSGLSAAGDQIWHQAKPGIEGQVEEADYFGVSLAAGDFNADGFDDLAVGVEQEGVDPGTGTEVYQAGAVNVLYGDASGLSATGDQIWHQASSGIVDDLESFDHYGSTLVALPESLLQVYLPLVEKAAGV